MTDSKQPISALSVAERTRLEQRLLERRQLKQKDAKSIIPIRSKGTPVVPSFSQQRLWFLERLIPDSGLYNIPKTLHLKGALNEAALEASLKAIVSRHEVLRTHLALVDGQLMQVIGESPVLPFEVVDLSDIVGELREERVKRLITEEAAEPFDLERGPLLRVLLLRLEPEERILLLTMHHLVSDGWSMGVLMRELSALYEAMIERKSSPLAALPIQYADYAVWQRMWLQGMELERQLGYWKEQLAELAPLSFPIDRPRPVEQSFRGAHYQFDFLGELTETLRGLSQRKGVTLFMTLLAAFQVLLFRYSGQTDVAVGSPIAGRNRSETEGLIGLFVNTLVLRTGLSGNPTFSELLGRVREVCLGAYDHQDLPFEKLVEELAPERDRSRQPFFGVMFVLQNAPGAALGLGEVIAEPVRVWNNTAKFDLTVSLTETAQGLQGNVEYCTDLFEAETITRLIGHYQVLLKGIAAEPDRKICTLPLLTMAEREQILLKWNDTAADYPKDQCIHRLFEAQVGHAPEAVAVVCDGQSLTYADLNARANQLARYLQGKGVCPEGLVALCVERSLEMVIGMLGILKTGGAYVPLDPSYPQERLAFMLADTEAPVLLSQRALASQLPEYTGQIVFLDSDWHRIEGESADNLPVEVNAENPAYVIYTSGSTGQPKGVTVTQHAVSRLVINTDYVQLGSTDRIAQVANCSFDAATFEIWGALLCGGQLVIISKYIALSPRALADEIKRTGITAMFLTTALFNKIASEVPDAFAPLRYLLFGGESVDPQWVRAVMASRTPQHLLHVYGPTENTTFSTWYPIGKVGQGAVTVPIGRPIANTQVYILDDHLNPVPVGVSGELYIGGDGLARGYLHQPELTAKNFIRHLTNDAPNTRLYKTGDLTRYLSDGNIEFLGRIDNQVKIRGFRIEPGEIEAVLNQHSAVRESIVLVREDIHFGKNLVAYIVPAYRSGHDDDVVGELRRFLKAKLPSFMVPSSYVVLERFPLTPNGKVDRKELRIQEQKSLDARTGHRWPEDALESQLLQIWEKVLRVHPIGMEDNFFELGGHSLLGVTLLFEIEKVIDHDLPLSVLFENPTIRGLAMFLRQKGGASHFQALVAIHPQGTLPPFFEVYGPASALAPHLDPDHPFYWFNWLAQVKRNHLNSRFAVQRTAADHLRELRSVQPKGPYYLGGFSFGGMVAYEMAQQLFRLGENVSVLALFDPTSPHTIGRDVSKYQRWRQKLFSRKGLFSKSNFVLVSLYYNAKRIIQNFTCSFYLATGRPMPPELSKVYLKKLSRQASSTYEYQPYPGHIDLFVPESISGSRDRLETLQLSWDELARDGVNIHIINGTTEHTGMFEEPFVREFARKLGDCIRAQCNVTAAEVRPSAEN